MIRQVCRSEAPDIGYRFVSLFYLKKIKKKKEKKFHIYILSAFSILEIYINFVCIR